MVVTAFEEDINRSALNSFFQVLFYAFISLLIAIILGYFLFRRVLKNINILSNTAKEVNKGNLSLRSKVKGEDDIGILGETFDSMLENIEKNFKTLDLEVEKRTKELIISLEEKEMLLKEIHHRVKNNLALTIGFIKLQQSKIKDESTKKVLSDIQERVFTMELLHRKLYESSNLNKIPMKEYISSLTFDIAKAYNISKDCIKLKLDEVDLNIQYAMPCGLILNELITNSFKYAYKKEFLLFISFKKLKNSYELIVLDNGEGFSKHIDIYKANSLGLKLITSIAKAQLKAKLTYDYEAGSKFTIVFSIH
ncbi:sensor histidine kinase [Malaciobacter mytili]|uniref:sensor histidine kinase n=1 Tax=Malaciobacter mytili TaxID=603050 RepID=UPI003A865840